MRRRSWCLLALSSALLAGGCPDSADSIAANSNDSASANVSSNANTNANTSTNANANANSSTSANAGDSGSPTLSARDPKGLLLGANKERTARGLQPLVSSERLDAAAAAHAADVAGMTVISHTGSDGSSVGDRATRAGYDWSRVGENISSGAVSADHAMSAWMNSEGHRANILNPEFTELGVAVNGAIWVQVFAAPR